MTQLEPPITKIIKNAAMYSVQVLNGNRWVDLNSYQPRSWDKAVELFTDYMARFEMHDYRIFPVVTLPEVK